MELVLREAIPDLPIPKYEQSIRTSTFYGRADALHHGLVIEYEKPKTLRVAKKSEHAVKQVWDCLTGIALRQGPDKTQAKFPSSSTLDGGLTGTQEEQLSANVGIETDGESFIFTQRKSKQRHIDPRKFDEDTVEKLLLWLRAMVRKDLSPDNLIADFGPDPRLATDVVSTFAKLVNSGKYPKASVIYEEWRRIFGIVYGTEQLERTGKDPETSPPFSAYHVDSQRGFVPLDREQKLEAFRQTPQFRAMLAEFEPMIVQFEKGASETALIELLQITLKGRQVK